MKALLKYWTGTLLVLLLSANLSAQQGATTAKEKTTMPATQDTIYSQVQTDRRAIYPGGTSAWEAFFAKNHRYPEVAKASGLQTTVVVRFIIQKDGSVTDPEIICSSHPLFTEEVLRLLKIMPKWKPALKHGKPCASYYKLPFIFQLKETPVDWGMKRWN
ncbi:MAG: energy transducer TonB [Paludibacteraceae bacterium]|nr:energy transducer TonB [Paludibacteraceae bacterium]